MNREYLRKFCQEYSADLIRGFKYNYDFELEGFNYDQLEDDNYTLNFFNDDKHLEAIVECVRDYLYLQSISNFNCDFGLDLSFKELMK